MKSCDFLLFVVLFTWIEYCLLLELKSQDVEQACAQAELAVMNENRKRQAAFSRGFLVRKGPSWLHQITTRAEVPKEMEDQAEFFCAVTSVLAKSNAIPVSEMEQVGGLTSPSFQRAMSECRNLTKTEQRCRHSKFYSLDGSCNNLQNGDWGRTKTCFSRLLRPVYEDDIDQLRVTSQNSTLPNPRLVSAAAFHADDSNRDQVWSFNRMAFGQFLAHDITLTPTTTVNAQPPECCNASIRISQCSPIVVPGQDPIVGMRNRCLNFVRSMPCPTCKLGPREQLNAATPFIDLSNIYGLSSEHAAALRLNDGSGRLRGQITHPKSGSALLLPATNQTDDNCSQPNRPCFAGGDIRVNQQIGISAWSTIFFRYHNKLALEFRAAFPSWSANRLYRSSRRVLIAQFQLIVFQEWLPSILGQKLLRKYKLDISRRTAYNPKIHPQLLNEFSTAAFRFGHSMVRDVFGFVDKDFPRPLFNVATRDAFSAVPRFNDVDGEFTVENLIQGLFYEYGKPIGPAFVSGITNFLYRTANEKFGFDLPAFNIHRGRDHGLGSYDAYFKLFRKASLTSWAQLGSIWYPWCLQTMPKLYKNVATVDLFVGGICEKPLEQGSVGATFGEIIAKQFQKLAYGDRLFVSHKGSQANFNDEQYRHLRSTTSLAGIFCQAGEAMSEVPSAAFNLRSFDDLECDEVPTIDPKLFSDV